MSELDAIRARAEAYVSHGTPGLHAPKDRAVLLAALDAVTALAERTANAPVEYSASYLAADIRAALTTALGGGGMSARVEAAAKAAYVYHSNAPGFDAGAAWDDMGGSEDWEREQWESEAQVALAAADAVMFNEAAVERVAEALAVSINKLPNAWALFQPYAKDVYRGHIRAIIAALKEAQG